MKRIWKMHETYVFLAILVLSAVITAINPNFFSAENFFDLLNSYAFLGILAVGMLVVLVSGGIDLSFTAVATVGEYLMAIFITRHGGNMAIAFLMSMAIGVALGMLNAVLIYYFDIPAVIATIGSLNVFYGLLIVFSGGKWIYTLPTWFRDFAQTKVISFANASGAVYGMATVALIWILVIVAVTLLLRYTVLGRTIYAVGGCGFDKSAATRTGINLLHVNLFVYGLMGFLAGTAGVVQALQVQTVAPNSIVGKELNVIAAVVLGGASLAGGRGTITGTLLGVALLAILSNGLTLMRVSSYWFDVAIGIVIIASVSASAIQQKRKHRYAIDVSTPAEVTA